jgi:predicted metal-dependent peptidase
MQAGAKLSQIKAELRLPVARLKASEAMPYFAGGVNDLVPHPIPGSGRIGVTREGVLLYDPELLGQWTALEAGTVLLHEYGHVFSRHAERFDALVKRGVAQRTQEDHDLFNVAADAEINDNLFDAGLPLPSINECPPVTPKSQGLEDHKTAEQYFVTLLERRQQQPPGGGGGGPQSPGCGSGAGNPQEWEPDQQTLDKLGRDTVSQDITRRATAERILERAKTRGDVPAGLLAQAEGEIPRSDIPWEDELRTAVFAGADAVAGIGDYTWTVPSRWQSALNDEYGDDAPVLPGEHQPLPRVAVAFDTSGSVSDEDLRRMCGHTMGIVDCLGGLDVTFLACDAQVHAVTKVSTVTQLMANMKGRGGTDFRPVFDEIAKFREQPDLLVFQTDLYGPFPDEPPPYPVTWLVTPGGDTSSKPPFGRTIYMDPEDARRARAA